VSLQESVHVHPGSETQHPADLSLGQAFAAVSLERKSLKSGTRKVRLLALDNASDIVRDL
jgi:hypothetical protein